MNREKFLSKLAYYFVLFMKKTIRLTEFDLVGRFDKQSVYALWHGEQILPLCLNSGRNIVAMCSMSKDGEIQAGVLKDFGFIAVRGSSSKRAERALIETIRYARKGHFVAFTVDGPKGPIYKVKSGLLLVSQKIGIRLIPISARAKNSLVFSRSWDKFTLPLPFSKTVIVYGYPIEISKEDNLEEKALVVEQELNKLREFTNKYFWSKDIKEYLSHHPKPKILVVKSDVTEQDNFIKDIKNKYKNIEIHYLTKSDSNNTDNIYDVNKNVFLLIKILKEQHYDVVINLENKVRTNFISNLLNVKFVIKDFSKII